jgi:hypothetical protein
VHLLEPTHNGIHWAGLDAQGAADTKILNDEGQTKGRFFTMSGIQRQVGAPGKCCQPANAFIATRGALIDVGLTPCDRLCVRLACRIATARALRLWQCSVNGGG